MHRPDPAWLDVQYNNRARVSDSAAIFERWRQALALARAKSRCHIDLSYGTGPNEALDVFPCAQPNAPVLVFIHGGWWRSLDKADHSFIAPAFVDADATVVLPNYALCPAVTIETIAMQMVRALAWVHRHIAAHGGDPARIVVAGHSAGGHLAAMLLACRWNEVSPDLPVQLVRSALAFSGVFDLEPIRHTPFLQADLGLTPLRPAPEPHALPCARGHAVCGSRGGRERRVPAAERLDTAGVGPAGGAGVRGCSRNQSLQRAARPSRSAGVAAPDGAAPARAGVALKMRMPVIRG